MPHMGLCRCSRNRCTPTRLATGESGISLATCLWTSQTTLSRCGATSLTATWRERSTTLSCQGPVPRQQHGDLARGPRCSGTSLPATWRERSTILSCQGPVPRQDPCSLSRGQDWLDSSRACERGSVPTVNTLCAYQVLESVIECILRGSRFCAVPGRPSTVLLLRCCRPSSSLSCLPVPVCCSLCVCSIP